ncbi:MAG: pyridoxamine 5'-phosphate oxidase family protein [Prevotellaceae bacterium]|jgi:uncharacterized protein YhbP (UPF0306 family)|nr:pyridoxamine 5'-phosphate oxidase family protein [Prevotellaceae bacterium]
MQQPEQRIADFLRKHHVLTLATCTEGIPWCASVFYVYMPAENLLIFTSEYPTRHIQEAAQNDKIAGTVALETKQVGLVRGVQFQGRIFEPTDDLRQKAKRAFLASFPYAILKLAPFWAIELYVIKFTDNRLGFGKKLHWTI